MRIDSVDLFYLSLPVVRDIGDGSQDALLVRVRSGDCEGWGECEASPLTTLASFVCPMSHSACHPVRDAVLGQPLESPEDIRRITANVRRRCFDLLQADHTLSGIDIALWDLLGRRWDEPVYRLLGYPKAYPKTAYASQLFGQTPDETYAKAQRTRDAGFRAAKFGWGPYGSGLADADAAQVRAAREGLGPECTLLIDAGTIWSDDVEAAAARLPALEACRVAWLEEPFTSGALHAYQALARRSATPLAAGEGAHHPHQAMHLIDYGGVRYIQIDTGRIGGITSAWDVAHYALAQGVTYVNHTFTTPLALSASLQPFAGLADHTLCEYPVEPSPLAATLTEPALAPDQTLAPDPDGQIHLPDTPGLGVTLNLDTIRKYLQPVEIRVAGRLLYQTPSI